MKVLIYYYKEQKNYDIMTMSGLTATQKRLLWVLEGVARIDLRRLSIYVTWFKEEVKQEVLWDNCTPGKPLLFT